MTVLPRSSMTPTLDASDASLSLGASGARRASEAPSESAAAPDPEVVSTAKHRHFSAAEKQRILAAADRCTQPGQIGALLRREKIYSSHLSTWRKQRRDAEAAALASKPRGPKRDEAVAQARQHEELARENLRLRGELERAHTIIDVQKKLCTLLGLPTPPQNGGNI